MNNKFTDKMGKIRNKLFTFTQKINVQGAHAAIKRCTEISLC